MDADDVRLANDTRPDRRGLTTQGAGADVGVAARVGLEAQLDECVVAVERGTRHLGDARGRGRIAEA
ncbi:hypothetical protein GCM10023317_95110 [Actinopolymorpha pittospori]|uniref:Uncharacterized protein n=1 Tax=Actinopolymorpha pittospori TaxID=648752 RepID=A0A927MY04_9ACTN|nr:hypothetical protein [Actinopolymorpha pittospori]